MACSNQVPRVLSGRYRIERLLGAGGMGVVYRARDLLQEQLGDSQSDVALKLLGENIALAPDGCALLFNEYALVRQLCHPNVLRMHNFDIDTEHHCAFIVMEHLPGPTLDRLLCERPLGLSLPELREIALPLLDALAHAHQRGVLHGDIKPGNVMLSETGVRLFDFGLGQSEAGVLKGLAPLSRTHFGAWTPGYAAPELLAGAPLTRSADVYGAGCLLYELATGKCPLIAPCPGALKHLPRATGPEKPRQLPPVFWRALQKALALDPAARSISIEPLREAFSETKKWWHFMK